LFIALGITKLSRTEKKSLPGHATGGKINVYQYFLDELLLIEEIIILSYGATSPDNYKI
jgi:hypothetical protein